VNNGENTHNVCVTAANAVVGRVVIYGVLDCAASASVNLPWKARFPEWLNLLGRWAEEIFMSVTDPIADMLTRIRNGMMAGHPSVAMPSSNLKASIAKILKEEGFINNFEVVEDAGVGFKILRIRLKYVGERRQRRPVITGIERVSRPGRRVYTGKQEIPWILSGMGIAILSTPKGVMTGQRARQLGVGGEILCKVW
jgi:small subunit ribosomal protein S8